MVKLVTSILLTVTILIKLTETQAIEQGENAANNQHLNSHQVVGTQQYGYGTPWHQSNFHTRNHPGFTHTTGRNFHFNQNHNNEDLNIHGKFSGAHENSDEIQFPGSKLKSDTWISDDEEDSEEGYAEDDGKAHYHYPSEYENHNANTRRNFGQTGITGSKSVPRFLLGNKAPARVDFDFNSRKNVAGHKMTDTRGVGETANWKEDVSTPLSATKSHIRDKIYDLDNIFQTADGKLVKLVEIVDNLRENIGSFPKKSEIFGTIQDNITQRKEGLTRRGSEKVDDSRDDSWKSWNFPRINKASSLVGDSVKSKTERFEGVKEGFLETPSKIVDGKRNFVTAAFKNLGGIGGKVTNMTGKGVDHIVDGVSDIKDGAQSLTDKILHPGKHFGPSAIRRKVVNKVLDDVQDRLEEKVGGVVETLSEIGSHVKNHVIDHPLINNNEDQNVLKVVNGIYSTELLVNEQPVENAYIIFSDEKAPVDFFKETLDTQQKIIEECIPNGQVYIAYRPDCVNVQEDEKCSQDLVSAKTNMKSRMSEIVDSLFDKFGSQIIRKAVSLTNDRL